MGKVSIKFDLGEKRAEFGAESIRQMETDFDRYAVAITARTAGDGVAYMKEHAPWTDRTTNARNGLHTVPKSSETQHEITFAGSVPYQIWLEIANSGKYQIIMPSVRKHGFILMQRFERCLGRLKRERGGGS